MTIGLKTRTVAFALATVLCVVGSVRLGSSRIIDPGGEGPSHDLLIAMEPAFERAKVDVVLGASRDLPPPDPARPRIAALAGFKGGTMDWGTIKRDSWERAFQKGTIGILTAFKPAAETEVAAYDEQCRTHVPPLASNGCRFVASWLQATPSNRVFLAFTSVDLWQAKKAKAALENAGYVVFIFLDGESAERWAEPSMIGEIFAQSSHRLVLDTQNSQGSAGVSFEASCEELLSSPRPPWTYLDLVDDLEK